MFFNLTRYLGLLVVLGFWFNFFVWSETDFKSVDFKDSPLESRLSLGLSKEFAYQVKELKNPSRIVVTFKEKVTCNALEPLTSTGLIQNVRFLTLQNKATEKTGIYYLDSIIIETADNVRPKVFFEENKLVILILSGTVDASEKEKSAVESAPEKPAPKAPKAVDLEAMNPVLTDVSANEIGTKTRLNLSFSKKAEYIAKEMKNPRRTVLTFREKIFCKNTKPLTFNIGGVKSVRFLTLKNQAAESAGLFLLDTLIIEYVSDVKEEMFFKGTQLMIDSEIVQKAAEESPVVSEQAPSIPVVKKEKSERVLMTPKQLNPLFNSAEIKEDGDKSHIVFSFTKAVDIQTKDLVSPKRVLFTFKEKVLCKSTEPLVGNGLIKSVRFLTLKNKATEESGLMFLDSVIIELNDEAKYKVSHKDSRIFLDAELDTEKMMAVADAAIKEEKAEANEMPVIEEKPEEQPNEKPSIEELSKNYTFLNQVELTSGETQNQIQFSFSKLPDYKLNELTNPTRLVMTFGEKILSKTVEPKTFETGTVKNIRYLTLKNQAFEEAGFYVVDSLIVEISDESVYELSKKDNLITLHLFPVAEKKADKKDVSSEKQENPAEVDQVSEKDSKQIETLVKSAKENYKNGYYLLAKSDCQTVLSLDPSNEEALKILGKAQEKIAEEKEKALKLADQLIAEKAIAVDAQKAQAAQLAGTLEKDMIEKGSKEEEFSAYMKNGQGLFKRKRYEEALEMWERALEIKPEDSELKDYMNKAREKIKERGQMQETGETITTPQQSEIDQLMSQGEAQFHNLQYTNAIASFERVLELDPKNVKAMRYVVQARKNQRSYVAEGGMPEDIVMKPIGNANDLGIISIEEALKIGLANHLPAKISQEEVFLAKYKVAEAKRQLYPQAKLKYKNTAGTTTGEDFKGMEYGTEFTQNLWSGGKYRDLYNQARVNLAVARKNHEKTKSEFIFEVIQAYYNYVFAKEKMKNKMVLKGNVLELLDIAEKQYNAKALTLAEILEARSQLEEVNFQVVQIENDLELAKLALQQLLSQPSAVDIDVAEMPEPFIFDLDETKLNDVAYKNRRDYQVNKLLVLFQKYGLEIAKKKEGYNVELTGTYGLKDEYYVTEQVDLKSEWFLGVKVSKAIGSHTAELNVQDQDKVPQIGQTTSSKFSSEELSLKLWDQKNQTAVTEANISYHKALSELENSKRTLVHDIRSSIYSVAESEAKIQNDKSILALSAEELRSTKAKQKADQSTIVQVMRAEAKFWNEKTDLVSDQADYYINIAKLNKNVGLNNYMDPATGLISTDKEDQTPGIRLVVHDKAKKRHWYNLLPFKGGIKSYYPDEVVTDILKEKQEKSAFESTKSFLSISRWFKKSAEDEMAEYKQYDEKYDFSTPLKDDKQSWWKFWKKKLDDDFSQFYSTTSEYNQAFGMERRNSLQAQAAIPVSKEPTSATTAVKKEEKDYFKEFLKDKTRKVFAEYHIEDNTYETVIAIRSNSKVEYSEKVLNNPSRIVFTFKDTVISALPAYDVVKTGAVISFKTIHTPITLPAEYKDWNKLLSIILELDSEREYKVESQDDMFKIIIKK